MNNRFIEFGKILIIIGFFPLVCLLKLIKPIKEIRIGRLNCMRIGHLSSNTECWLRKEYLQNSPSNKVDLFISGRPVTNRQLLKMIKRRLRVFENALLAKIYMLVSKALPWGPWIDLTDSGESNWRIWKEAPAQLSFTRLEHEKGQTFLRSIGINEGNEFVCFAARDNAFVIPGQDYSYHDYRNASIKNYIPAIEALTKHDIYGIRMGAAVSEKLNASNPKIVDYATEHRSDFLDVYLMAHCKFFVGDTAGIGQVGNIFNVPCIQANNVPFHVAMRSSRGIFIPKKFIRSKDKRQMTYPEIIDMGADQWYYKKFYEQAGIDVIENSADEIIGVVMEMNSRIDGRWTPQAEDDALQQKYRDMFGPAHAFRGYPSSVGTEFLRQNKRLLEKELTEIVHQ